MRSGHTAFILLITLHAAAKPWAVGTHTQTYTKRTSTTHMVWVYKSFFCGIASVYFRTVRSFLQILVKDSEMFFDGRPSSQLLSEILAAIPIFRGQAISNEPIMSDLRPNRKWEIHYVGLTNGSTYASACR